MSMRSKIGGFDFFRPSGLGGTGSVGLKWGSWKTAEDDVRVDFLFLSNMELTSTPHCPYRQVLKPLLIDINKKSR